MFPTRRDFRSEVAPSDRQLWAIGMVVVQWSNLETLTTIATEALLQDDPTALAEFQQDRSARGRLDTFQRLISDELIEPHRTTLLSLVRDMRDVQLLRDRIVHGSWASKDGATLDNPEAQSTFGMLKPRQPFEWKLDFGKLKATALKIEDLNSRLQNAMLDELLLGEQSIVLSEAMRRKRKAR